MMKYYYRLIDALKVDKLISMLEGKKYQEIIDMHKAGKIKNSRWISCLLVAEAYFNIGDTKECRRITDSAISKFLGEDYNSESKKYVLIFVYKKFGYKSIYWERLAGDSNFQIDRQIVAREIKTSFPMDFSDQPEIP